jgi:hypothetical protein
VLNPAGGPGESYRDYCFQANPQVESVDCLEGLIAGSPGVEKKVIESGLSPKGKGRRVDPQPKIQNLLQLLSLPTVGLMVWRKLCFYNYGFTFLPPTIDRPVGRGREEKTDIGCTRRVRSRLYKKWRRN